jgi:hypothetical protein
MEIIDWTQAVLTNTPGYWLAMSQTLPEELLLRRPASGEWSALECLQHLLDTEREVFPRRVEWLLEEQDFPAFDPDAEGSRVSEQTHPAKLADEFLRLRAESLDLLEKVTPGDLEKRARHQELGEVSLRELLHEWAAHDLMHTVQAERALMQPFIAGSGPWQEYFKDHWAG